MPFIENVSLESIISGTQSNHPSETILIRFLDPDRSAEDFPAHDKFSEEYVLKFGDLGSCSYIIDEELDEWKMTYEQAAEIASILRRALEYQKNVTVHCSAGLCRSGAVVEAALELSKTLPPGC